MTAYLAGWGVGWLVLWAIVLGVAAAGRHREDTSAIAGYARIGIIISVSWLCGVAAVWVLS